MAWHKQGLHSCVVSVQVLAEAAARLPAAPVAERYVIVWQTQQPATVVLRQSGRSHRSRRRVQWQAREKGGRRVPLQPRAEPASLSLAAASADQPRVAGTPAHAGGGEPCGRTQGAMGGCKGVIPSSNPARDVLRSVAWLQAAVRALPQGAAVQLRTAGALSFPAAAEAPGATLPTWLCRNSNSKEHAEPVRTATAKADIMHLERVSLHSIPIFLCYRDRYIIALQPLYFDAQFQHRFRTPQERLHASRQIQRLPRLPGACCATRCRSSLRWRGQAPTWGKRLRLPQPGIWVQGCWTHLALPWAAAPGPRRACCLIRRPC